jgi:hypothetical protein
MPAVLLAQITTTTTEVRRVVGEPPATWVPVAAGAAVLVAILVLGWIANRRRAR